MGITWPTINSQPPPTSCSSSHKCACSITCPPGTYQDEDDQTTCKSCTAGKYQQEAGQAECTACSTNTYSLHGASSCDFTATTCPAGTYASGSAACTLCGEGKYNDLTGQTSCKTCPGVTNDERTACSQKPMIQEKTSGKCSDLAGGSSTTSAAECEQVAAALGFADVVVGHTYSANSIPPGCYLHTEYTQLTYNTLTTSTASCSNSFKCACSVLCPPGTYQDEDDQTTCKSCAAGKYQQEAGQAECTACSTNTYSPLGASSCVYSATNCPAGTYASGTAACTLCGEGKYHDLTGQTSCKTCHGVTNDDRTVCSQKPMYQEKTSGKCSNLAGGSSITSIAECELAAVGLGWSGVVVGMNTGSYSHAPPGCYLYDGGHLCYNTLTTSTSSCSSTRKCACSTLCQPGTYQDEDGQTTCKSCAAGKYQQEAGQAACTACSTNTYSPPGASGCDYTATTCPAGTYAAVPAACEACTHVTDAATVTCTSDSNSVVDTCNDGTWLDSGSCTACQPVTNGLAPNVVTCTSATTSRLTGECSSAFWKDTSDDFDVCTACQPVTNGLAPNVVTCTSATMSKLTGECSSAFWKDTSDDFDVCTACQPVTNGLAPNVVTCTSATTSKLTGECSSAFWKDTSGDSDVCTACTAIVGADDTFNSNVGPTYTCTSNSDTRFATGGCATATTKKTVAAGGPLEVMLSIKIVFDEYPEDTSWELTSTECQIQSNAGDFAGSAESLIDVSLPRGCTFQWTIHDSYFDGFGGSYTLKIDTVTITDADGREIKKEANTNEDWEDSKTYVFSTAADVGTMTTCTAACAAGTRDNENVCTACTAGTYGSGTAACVTTCPAGTYASDDTSECETCSPGGYSPLGASSCDFTATTCPAGTFASGSAACTLCGEGKYNDLTGQTSCKTCPGVTNDERTACSQKPMIQEKTSQQCSNLAGGSSITSAAECDQAAVALGWSDVVVGENTWSWSNYPPGCSFYGDLLRYNTLTASTEHCSSTYKCACSILCPPGTYQDEDGQTTCKSCAAGKYQEEAGQAECTACSTNTYSLHGASSCDFTATTCPAGTYASGSAACTLCGEGKYNDLTGQTSCKTCPGVTNDERTACSQKPMLQEKTSGQCSNLAGGSTITSAAECDQAAVALGWSDVVVGGSTISWPELPPGCLLSSIGKLGYNALTTSTTSCSSSHKCACSITCPPGTYQDEDDQTTCKSCAAGKYQEEAGKSECAACTAGYSPPGASSCDFTATTCPAGTYASGTAACTQCGDGKSSVKGGECYLLAKSENLDQIKVWYNKYNQCS